MKLKEKEVDKPTFNQFFYYRNIIHLILHTSVTFETPVYLSIDNDKKKSQSEIFLEKNY